MRRSFYQFFAFFVALSLSTLSATAGWVFTGGEDADPIPAAQLQVGGYYVFEPAATSQAGHYLGRNASVPTTFDSTVVWVLEDAGKSATTGEQQYYLRNLGYGTYYNRNNGSSSSKDDDLVEPFLFHASTASSVAAGSSTIDFSSQSGTDATSTIAYLTVADDGTATPHFIQCWVFGPWTIIQSTTSRSSDIQWNVRQVEWEVNLQADLAEAISKYEQSDYSHIIHGTVDPFAIKDSVYNALISAYNTAVAEVGQSHTNEEYQTYLDNLNSAMAAADNAANVLPMSDGYYYIVTANNQYISNSEHADWANMAMYANNGRIYWNKIGTNDSSLYIWHITTADGGYTVQNMGDASYMYGPVGSSDDERRLRTTTAAERTMNLTYRRRGYITLQANGYSGMMRYFNQENGNGTNTSGSVSTWAQGSNDGTSWHLVRVTDDALLARLEAELPQKAQTGKFIEAREEAQTLVYDNQGSYQPTGEKLVTAASQISTNNPEQSEGTTANGGGYEGLLDGDLTTYYHAAWNSSSETDQNYNYIQVHLESGLPTNVAIWWARRITNNNNRPISLLIQTSTDGTTWSEGQTLSNPEGRFPTAATDTFYTSPNITLPEGQTYLRLSVLHTSPSDRCVVQPYPYFTMSEFNLYPGSVQVNDPSETQTARAEVKPVYEALVAAYNTAQAVDATTATSADLEALQTAIDNFKSVLADTTQVTDAISDARSAISSASVGSGYGQFPQTAVNTLRNAINTVNAARPLYNYTRVQIDSIANSLREAIAAFNSSITLPEDGVYYIVSNISSDNSRGETTRGRVMFAQSYSVTSNVNWGGLPSDNADNSRAGWLFKHLGDGTFTLQNVGSGGYMGTTTNLSRVRLSHDPVAYEFVPLGDGEIALRPAQNGVKLDAYDNGGVFAFEESGGGKGSPCSWTFEEVNTGFNEYKRFESNRTYIVTVPYNTYEVPIAANGDANVAVYDVTGTVKSAEGAIVALTLTQRETGLKAGQPVVMTVSSNDDEAYIAMQLDLEDLGLTNTPGTANGLHGVFSTHTLDSAGYGYFVGTTDTLQVTVTGEDVDITRQQGYVVPFEIQNVEGASVDLTIPVAGDGIVNAIGRIVSNNSAEQVNVYSIDGVLIKKQVPAAKAAQGLTKGLYIVNGKKVLVK